ncbi:alpha/beta fold hydrolase [Roseibium sp. M-1]
MILFPIAFLAFLAVLLLCALYSVYRYRRISRAFAPDGSFAVVDGVRLHYHFVPASAIRDDLPVLVFLHGASGNSYDMRMALEKPLRQRFSLLFVDRPGLGFSDPDPSGLGAPEGQAKLIAGLLKTLQIDSAIIVGHSLGGSVTAALGLAAPERVKGLVFLAPVSHVWPGGVNWYYRVAALPVIGFLFTWTLTLTVGERLVPGMLAHVFHPDPAPAGYANAVSLPLLFRPASFRSNARDVCGLKAAVCAQAVLYPQIGCPALIVTGTDDTVVWPSIHCEGLLRDLPQAELLMLDRAGHMPHHTHREEIAAAVERLAERVTEASMADPGAEKALQLA